MPYWLWQGLLGGSWHCPAALGAPEGAESPRDSNGHPKELALCGGAGWAVCMPGACSFWWILSCFFNKTSSAWPGLLSPCLLQHLLGGQVVVPGAGARRHLAARHLLEPPPGLSAGNSSAGSAVLQLCFQEQKAQNSGLCLAPCPCPQAAGRRGWCGPRSRDPSLRTEPRVSLVPCWHRAPGMDPHPKSSALNFLLTLQPLVLQCIPGTWEQCGVCAPSEEQRARHPGTRALA